MILNTLERRLVNSWPRALVQHHVEAAWMLRVGGPVPGGAALEIGCGRGVGGAVIFERFHAATLHAFDLDPEMVAQAGVSLAKYGARVTLWTGDATAIQAEDASFDAVFEFAILHHVEDWRAALREVRRVLKPGGRFYASEVLDRFIAHPVARRLFVHPQEGRFSARVFCQALEAEGFSVLGAHDLLGQFGAFVALRGA